MTAESPLHSARLPNALIPIQPPLRRRGRGVLAIVVLLASAAALLALAVMFLPLSPPRSDLSPASGSDTPRRAAFIPPFG